MGNGSIGVGIIGLSSAASWAARSHLPALRAVPGYEITALATSRIETAEVAAKTHNVPAFFDDPLKLAMSPEVDVVVIAVKVPRHRELVTAAVQAGKTIYCEWPLGNGRADAEAIANLAQDKGVRAFVGLQGHASPALRYVRDLVASGRVGDVVSTTLVASAGAWGATIEPRLIYGLDRQKGVSMLTVQFGHTIDGLCWCLGEFCELSATLATRFPLVKRTDTGEMMSKTIDDQIAVNGILENGAVASVHYRSGTSKVANFLWEINGTMGDLVITGDHGRLQYNDFRIRGTTPDELEDLPVPDSYKLVANTKPSDIFYTLAHTYKLLQDDIRNGTHHVPTFSDALVRHRMIDAIEKSSAEGTRQTYDW
jgi:predicted dehydrogenase